MHLSKVSKWLACSPGNFQKNSWIAGILFFLMLSCNALGSNLPLGFVEVKVAGDLDPVSMALAPDGRLFVAEKSGRILIIENGLLKPDPFMIMEVDNFNERGFSGIAIHPDFETQPYVYLYYTVPGANHNRVSRFRAEGDFVVPGSEEILLDLDNLTGPNHNAGALQFGPGGKLYISTGDGTTSSNSQKMTTLLGKILRINDDGTLPDDNPFYEETEGKYRAIYALGFRNPFAMTIQPGTGRIFCGDVGGTKWEEVNEVLPGRNYGWPIIEGKRTWQTPPGNYMDPLYAYSHSSGCAIVGVAFYNPETEMFPGEYAGKFFFSDYCSGKIKMMDPDNGEVQNFASNIDRPLNMLVAPDGTFYYIARGGLAGGSSQANTASNDGTIWRIIYTGNGAPFVSINPQPVLIPIGENARFFTQASGQSPFQYQWQRNGQDIPGATEYEYNFENAMLSDSGAVFRCIISNAEGIDTTLDAMLRVTTSQRPQPVILKPDGGMIYRAGDTLIFEGSATDPEDGELPAANLRWKLDFHHNSHTHPAIGPTPGITGGTFEVSKIGETAPDVWYRFSLTATDESGLTNTAITEIYPKKSVFDIKTIPAGIPFFLEGEEQSTPAAIQSVVGLIREIELPNPYYANDSIYVFRGFTSGQKEAAFDFEVPDENVSFTAIYEAYPTDDGTGLRGYYYDKEPGASHEFEEPYDFTKVDSVINFSWGYNTPNLDTLGQEYYMVKWEGFIKPLFGGPHTFYVTTDDGARLWVGNQLVIDAWLNQPPTEYEGSIGLKAGQYYPLRLEYFQDGGDAAIKLRWSHENIGKSVVPKTQLYPNLPGDLEGLPTFIFSAYPTPVRGKLMVEFGSSFEQNIKLNLLDAAGKVVLNREVKIPAGTTIEVVDLSGFPAGIYFLQAGSGTERQTLKIFKS
jgi:glucose/arabinose dehydrogenase